MQQSAMPSLQLETKEFMSPAETSSNKEGKKQGETKPLKTNSSFADLGTPTSSDGDG